MDILIGLQQRYLPTLKPCGIDSADERMTIAYNALLMARDFLRCGCAICGKGQEESDSEFMPVVQRNPASEQCLLA